MIWETDDELLGRVQDMLKELKYPPLHVTITKEDIIEMLEDVEVFLILHDEAWLEDD